MVGLTTTNNSITRQIDRELKGAEAGKQEFLDEWRNDKKVGHRFDGPVGQKLIRSMLGRLRPIIADVRAQAMREIRESGNQDPWQAAFLTMDPEVLGYLTLRTFLTQYTVNNHQISLASKIGTACDREHRLREMRDAERERLETEEEPTPPWSRYEAFMGFVKTLTPRKTSILLKRLEDLSVKPWDQRTRLHVGLKLLFTLVQLDEVEEVRRSMGRGAKGRTYLAYTYNLTPDARKALEDDALAYAEMCPWLEPMVCPPRDYAWNEERQDYTGGYWKLQKSLIKSTEGGYAHTAGIMDELEVPQPVLDAVNRLQGTSWRINRGVLDVLIKAYETGQTAVLPVAPWEDPLPLVPQDEWDAMSKEERREILNNRRAIHDNNYRMGAKRSLLQRQMAVAAGLRGEPAVWFPHQLDWRGRAYPLPADLHPQANDVARGLLEFAEGKPLGERGWEWLQYRVATTYGMDKLNRAEQIAWTYSNHVALFEVAIDPLGAGLKFWTEAEDPWQFLAAALEYRQALYNTIGDAPEYVSHLPIYVDGSCNGLQHLSAMGLDNEGGHAVNLAPDPERQDVYQRVADKTVALLEKSKEEQARGWDGRVNRKVVKRATMTVPYGVTKAGISAQLLADGWAENRTEATFLQKKITSALASTLVKAREIMKWLQDDVARPLTEAGRPVEWYTPMGLRVLQAYWRPLTKTLQTHVGQTKVRRARYRSGAGHKPELDLRKQVNGIVPNLIHSFDAAHMMMTINACPSEMNHFAMIHDSFGVHGCDMDDLQFVIRWRFSDIYEKGDVLRNLRKDFEAAGQCELAKPPRTGDLDIYGVRYSEWFFS